MKFFLILACCVFIFSNCSRKTLPPKPNTVLENNNNNTDTVSNNNNSDNNGNVFADSPTTSTNSSALVMVVADSYGRLITPQQNLPDSGIQYNSLQLSKGLTVQQRANLQARYKMVPPRVLYVPQVYALNSLKGSYYIYRKKFWYWKRSDGLFYLDQKYYQ